MERGGVCCTLSPGRTPHLQQKSPRDFMSLRNARYSRVSKFHDPALGISTPTSRV